tara:strand:- start:244 stop:690 length:447 start_codon:yes stop_codon:yes gene_type:complete
MILELTPNTHPILHNKIRPCSVNLDRHFVAKTLIENMLHYDGVGLAANQIGMEVRAFAMVRDLENNEIVVCFNPKIVKKYNEVVNFEEGCLSFPDKIVRVDRPDRIVVQYEDKDKKIHKIKLNGFAARVFQHELDHLEGIDFTQRSSK